MRMIESCLGRLWQAWAMLLLTAVVFGGGCAGPNPADPYEQSNRFFYDVNDGIDKVALKPLSDGYVAVMPKEGREAMGNAFANLGYFNVILNDFLQGKWDQGWSDAGRMTVNSTIGIGGFFDVAVHWGMPSHENDFGITLGKWGAQPGPYMVLPLLGPSCARDVPAVPVEIVTDPTTWLDMPIGASIGLYAAEAVDARSNAAQALRFRNAAALDPYVFTRDAYLQYREAQIHEGKTTPKKDIYEEEEAPATQPTTPPTTQPTGATTPAASQ
jgi:phospholipid-binding lipoprotein MlaA